MHWQADDWLMDGRAGRLADGWTDGPTLDEQTGVRAGGLTDWPR